MLHSYLGYFRRRAFLSQSELGKLAGLSKNSISAIENGSGCSLRNAFRLAQVLHCSVDDLFVLDPVFKLTSNNFDSPPSGEDK